MTDQRFDGPVYDLEDAFRFQCAPGVSCFNECCRDVTIFLGPFDVLRLKQILKMKAQDFIDRYTIVLATDRLIPLISLRMNEDNNTRCHFVTPEGCSVYSHRPWACRMFPLDVTEDGKGFRPIIDDQRCKGLLEKVERRVQNYLNEQGAPKYQVMDDLMGELINHERFRLLDVDNDQVRQMIYMALYDLDAFRDFVFKSSFLQKFKLDDRRIKRLERDDEELLRLGFEWLNFGLLGRQIFTIRDEVVEEYSKRQGDEQ
jgi:hypothetical protein